ncbi:alpha/beta hydrolase [Anditalea andensis]|uniref:Esterase n=1 Tax=Anditalea andensis TaxID=1048983 RepID=A0A074L1L8_9BACT|nr:alpha/beta hydrolase-fold protein [Anditalea andensis]KEO73753.1 hypothetical protein EL17_09560 [Anditalea andensis]
MKISSWIIITLLAHCPLALAQETILKNNSNGDKIMMHLNFSSKHVANRSVEVWLPPGYEGKKEKKYPVIYMHDGQFIFNSKNNSQADWGMDQLLSTLISEGKTPEIIVVAIWNTPYRIAEYMPQKAFDLLSHEQLANIPNIKGFRPQSDEYLKFIVTELKPFIDHTYPTLPERENTAIMGASMGGLISLYAICEYPEIFGYAGCLSTHFPIGNGIMLEYLKSHLPEPEHHKIYYDFGTRTLDAQYEPYQRKVDLMMKEQGWVENKNWITKKFEGHDHSEKAWRSRVHIPLIFFFGLKETAGQLQDHIEPK